MGRSVNYNKLIPEILQSRKKPYPVHKHNFTSEKYNYVYNESLNDITYWHGRLSGLIRYQTKWGTYGFTAWNYYSDSEERCAKEVYTTMKRFLRRVTRENKRRDNGHYRKHLNWQKWIANYESIIHRSSATALR